MADCQINNQSIITIANKRTNRLRVYRRLLTNRLHGKAAELCLANS